MFRKTVSLPSNHSKLSVNTLCTEYAERIGALATVATGSDETRYRVEMAVNQAVASLTVLGVKSPANNLRIFKARLAAVERRLVKQQPEVRASFELARSSVELNIERLTSER